MRRLAAFASAAVLGLALSACTSSAPFVSVSTRCLTGPAPRVGRPVPDEMFALMRRERDRAERASPLGRARILEAVPSLFPDVSDLLLEPRCSAELAEENAAAFRADPLVFSRLLVARIRSVHDPRILWPLVTRDEKTITDYQRGPDEPGPPPPKSLVRLLALASIPAHWVVNNEPEARRHLLDRVRTSNDARELILLHGAAVALFDEAPGGDPRRAGGGAGPSLLRAWLPDLERRLQGPADPVALELVLLRLAEVGRFGPRVGVVPEARALVDKILAARGELPLTQGIPGAARDLAEVARGTLHDLEAPQRMGFAPPLPPPRRSRFFVFADWLDAEPAGGRVSAADALARVRDLDGELATLRFNAPRCRVLDELGEWLPPDEASRRFDALLSPAFDGDRIRLSTETLCRMGVGLRLDGVEEARRVKLLLRLLTATPQQIGERDRSGDGKHPALGWSADEEPVAEVAAQALARNLGWIDRHPELRAWLEAQALAPIPLGSAAAERWGVLQPAFDRLLALHTSGGPDAKPEMAAAILRAFMQSVREAEGAKGVTHIYVGEVMQARVRALGEYGRRAGIAEEIGAFLDNREPGRQKGRAAVIASYLLTL